MYNPFSLEGKTILVTGASSGIGRATAIECSKMGATVVITGRNAERLQETFDALEGEGHRQVIADLSEQEGIESLVGQFPPLDGAALCAGIGLTLPVQFSTREKFDKIFNTNFFSPVETTRLLYKKKILKPESSLVFIASIGGIYSFNYGNGIYGTSKAALNSFMQFCAHEFAARKVRVNSIIPGMVETPFIHRGTISEEQLERYLAKYPLKRFGRPNDIAWGVIYLLSDASCWVTGTSVVIDGGGNLVTLNQNNNN